jgi:hypothetical protein
MSEKVLVSIAETLINTLGYFLEFTLIDEKLANFDQRLYERF